MFKLFGKKKAEEGQSAPAIQEKSPEMADFAAQFGQEELTILALTGPNGFSGGKLPKEKLWTASIGLTAWMEEDGPDVHREEIGLVTLADDKLMEYLRQRVPRDFIIKVKVRPALDGKRMLMEELPQPGFDPELKAILEEQKKPVTLEDEALGTFTLNRSVNWFETDVDWLGQSVSLTFDSDENQAGSLQTAHALVAAQQDWDRQVRERAAGELLDLAGDWARDGANEGEEPEEITRESFMERMELDAIEVCEDGSFEFWFNDGGLFWGHSIRVSGSLSEGATDASMEG